MWTKVYFMWNPYENSIKQGFEDFPKEEKVAAEM
jgi:hypothetical protein